jgi:DNA-binding NarL/FixJ family response regulator
MKARILLIGQGLFLDGLTHLLGEQPEVELIGSAQSWEEARAVAAARQPDILIVDHARAELREADLAPLLENTARHLKVIYLTLSENKMIIHNRQQFGDVTVPDLLQALRIADLGGGADR